MHEVCRVKIQNLLTHKFITDWSNNNWKKQVTEWFREINETDFNCSYVELYAQKEYTAKKVYKCSVLYSCTFWMTYGAREGI